MISKVYQVYCDDESGINKWLLQHIDIEVLDFKMAVNEDGELITVIYKIEVEV